MRLVGSGPTTVHPASHSVTKPPTTSWHSRCNGILPKLKSDHILDHISLLILYHMRLQSSKNVPMSRDRVNSLHSIFNRWTEYDRSNLLLYCLTVCSNSFHMLCYRIIAMRATTAVQTYSSQAFFRLLCLCIPRASKICWHIAISVQISNTQRIRYYYETKYLMFLLIILSVPFHFS